MLKISEIFEFSRVNSYFERIRMVRMVRMVPMVRMVRMVRSFADRTFQLWPRPARAARGRPDGAHGRPGNLPLCGRLTCPRRTTTSDLKRRARTRRTARSDSGSSFPAPPDQEPLEPAHGACSQDRLLGLSTSSDAARLARLMASSHLSRKVRYRALL